MQNLKFSRRSGIPYTYSEATGKIQNHNPRPRTLLSFTFWSCLLFIFIFYVFSFGEGEFVYDAKGKRNPFIPLVTSKGELLLEKEENIAGILLEGIIYDKNGLSYAIVNGEVVKVGDKIGDYQILKVEKNKVIFIKEGQISEVELKEE